MKYEEVTIGDTFSREFTVTEDMIKRYGVVVGDMNPLHFDKQYVAGTIFKRPIAHGMLVLGFISSVLGNDYPGVGTIYLTQDVTFHKPVYSDDVVTVTVKVQDKNNGVIKIRTTCTVEDYAVVTGTAQVSILRGK